MWPVVPAATGTAHRQTRRNRREDPDRHSASDPMQKVGSSCALDPDWEARVSRLPRPCRTDHGLEPFWPRFSDAPRSLHEASKGRRPPSMHRFPKMFPTRNLNQSNKVHSVGDTTPSRVQQGLRQVVHLLRSLVMPSRHNRRARSHGTPLEVAGETEPATFMPAWGVAIASRSRRSSAATSSPNLTEASNTERAAEGLPLFAYEDPDDGTIRVLC